MRNSCALTLLAEHYTGPYDFPYLPQSRRDVITKLTYSTAGLSILLRENKVQTLALISSLPNP